MDKKPEDITAAEWLQTLENELRNPTDTRLTSVAWIAHQAIGEARGLLAERDAWQNLAQTLQEELVELGKQLKRVNDDVRRLKCTMVPFRLTRQS